MRHDMGETSISLEKIYMIEKSKISQKEGAYMMSKKLKISKCISYACLTVTRLLADSGSIELCEIIRELNFIYLCISYDLSINVQSYQRNICEIRHTLSLILRHVSYVISI